MVFYNVTDYGKSQSRPCSFSRIKRIENEFQLLGIYSFPVIRRYNPEDVNRFIYYFGFNLYCPAVVLRLYGVQEYIKQRLVDFPLVQLNQRNGVGEVFYYGDVVRD